MFKFFKKFKKQKETKRMSKSIQEYLEELITKRDLIVKTRSYLQHQTNMGANSPATRMEYGHRLNTYMQQKDVEFRTLEEEIEALDFYLKQEVKKVDAAS